MWRDRVRILLMNKFKDRLVNGYTARDIPILFEHFDLTLPRKWLSRSVLGACWALLLSCG